MIMPLPIPELFTCKRASMFCFPAIAASTTDPWLIPHLSAKPYLSLPHMVVRMAVLMWKLHHATQS